MGGVEGGEEVWMMGSMESGKGLREGDVDCHLRVYFR